MTGGNINNANKMLMYRTILCFAEGNECTVTGISKRLNAQKYQVSRVLTMLEQKGIVEKNDRGVPFLTGPGERYIEEYRQRVDLLVSFLLRAKLEPNYARDIALHIAGHANDSIMGVIETHERKLQAKDAFQNMKRFTGGQLAKKVSNGSFRLPCIILERRGELDGFFQPNVNSSVILNIVNDKGNLQYHPENDLIREIYYFHQGDRIQAEKVGDMFFLPSDALQFAQMGGPGQFGNSYCGMVNVLIKYGDSCENRESQAVFEIIL